MRLPLQISYGASDDASFFEYDNEAAADSMGSFVHRWVGRWLQLRLWKQHSPLHMAPDAWLAPTLLTCCHLHPRSMAELEYKGSWARLNVDLVRGPAWPACLPAAARPGPAGSWPAAIPAHSRPLVCC